MIEIRWHGRGGDGAFTVAKILGCASSIYDKKNAQAFPSFGPERRGGPVLAFTRINDEVITEHSQVYECDYIVVMDETLCDIVDTKKGLKDDGIYIINTQRSVEDLKKDIKFKEIKNLISIDATSIALDTLGKPIVNTVLLGALAGVMDTISIDSLQKAIDDILGKNIAEKNKKAVEIAYNKVRGGCLNV